MSNNLPGNHELDGVDFTATYAGVTSLTAHSPVALVAGGSLRIDAAVDGGRILGVTRDAVSADGDPAVSVFGNNNQTRVIVSQAVSSGDRATPTILADAEGRIKWRIAVATDFVAGTFLSDASGDGETANLLLNPQTLPMA